MGGRSKAVRDAAHAKGIPGKMSIPCWRGHNHVWPTEGHITMEDVGRCQVICQFCSVYHGIYNESKHGWQLRRHVYQVHRKEFPNLIVPKKWEGKKETSKGKVGPAKGSGKGPQKKTTKKIEEEIIGVVEPVLENPNIVQDLDASLMTFMYNTHAENALAEPVFEPAPNNDFDMDEWVNWDGLSQTLLDCATMEEMVAIDLSQY